MIALLVVIQSLAAILLGAVSLIDGVHRPDGGLNRRGYVLLVTGATVFLMATVSIQVLNDAESRQNQRRIEQLIERYFALTAESVMTTPQAPSAPPPATTGQELEITSPDHRSEGEARQLITGTVSDPSREVWIVVHPLGTSSYWIQPGISVSSTGTWRGMAYLGRPGNIDTGKLFQIVALAEPEEPIREGDNFSTWPRAKWVSKPITVTRR